MSSERPRRRRRRISEETSSASSNPLDAVRQRYRDIAIRMELTGWSLEPVFREREEWLWDELWALAEQRGLARPGRRPAEQVAPVVGHAYWEGTRQQYRDLATRLEAVGAFTDEAALPERERQLWMEVWALAEQRGILAPTEPPLPREPVHDAPQDDPARAERARQRRRLQAAYDRLGRQRDDVAARLRALDADEDDAATAPSA